MVELAYQDPVVSLFPNFKNKDEIMSTIKAMQRFAKTVMRRVELIITEISLLFKSEHITVVCFPCNVMESIDVVDTAQIVVFVRMVFTDYTS